MQFNRLQTLLSMYNPSEHDSFVLFAIAKEYEYLKDSASAIQCYKDLKERDAAYVGLYYHLAKQYEEIEAYKTALEVYDEGINQAKKQADFHALSELLNAKQNLEIEM
jgi:tetratricopeptide (TPR) repeat protein